jgi:hypothetical protein
VRANNSDYILDGHDPDIAVANAIQQSNNGGQTVDRFDRFDQVEQEEGQSHRAWLRTTTLPTPAPGVKEMRRTTSVSASPLRWRRNRLLYLVQGASLLVLTLVRIQLQSWQKHPHVMTAVADALAVEHYRPFSNPQENHRRHRSRSLQRRQKDRVAWRSRQHASFVQSLSLMELSSSSAHESETNSHGRDDSQQQHHQHQHQRAGAHNPILQLLQRHNYQSRLRTIDARRDLPLYAEAFWQGTSELVRIVQFVAEPAAGVAVVVGDADAANVGSNGTPGSGALKEPKAVVEIVRDDDSGDARSTPTTVVVDLAQITTVFFPHDIAPAAPQRLIFSNTSSSSSTSSSSAVRGRGSESSRNTRGRASHELVNDRALERALDWLYGSRVGRGRSVGSSSSASSSSSSSGLSKKQVHAAVQNWFASSSSTQNPARSEDAARHAYTYPARNETADHAERVLRQTVKIGAGSTRLVDASVLWQSVRRDNAGRNRCRMNDDNTDDRAADFKSIQWAGRALAKDAQTGGRFKRWPCVVVGCTAVPNRSSMRDDEAPMAAAGTGSRAADEMTVTTISILNGGWLAVDQSVRAGAEARKFVERRSSPPPASAKIANHTTRGTDEAGTPSSERAVRTQADMRIIQRLECLAMGEDLSPATDRLELDVRETLSAMNLDLSPSGAKQALLQVGWWTRDISSERSRVEPWSSIVVRSFE